jgi:hypothetical protein
MDELELAKLALLVDVALLPSVRQQVSLRSEELQSCDTHRIIDFLSTLG